MPKRRKILCALLGSVLLAGCGDDGRRTWEFDGATMGTTFSVSVVASPGTRPQDELGDRAKDLLVDIEQSMSTYLVRSEVSRFNSSSSTDWFAVSPMVCGAVEESLAISARTGGAFDITVGPLVNVWGFGPEGTRREPPDDALVEAARNRVGYDRLETDCARPALRKSRPDVYIDLSAYAKGFAVDRLVALLDDEGLRDYMVEVGGELRMRGTNGDGGPWRIAIETPADSGGAVQRVVELTDLAVATSGDYRNFFEFGNRRYSHTIDPRRGAPVEHDLAAVTVIAQRAAFADAMATALLVLGPEEGMQLAERQDLAVYFQRRTTDGFSESMSSAFRRLAKTGD